MANEISPMMTRYLETKEQYPDCILFYRLGDFYEMFFDDALTASRELELTLTGKSCGMAERAPMCGVPHHSAEVYIERLVAKGYKVAVCEQMEDPKAAKGLVARDVVRVVTPGTRSDEGMLDDKRNNYLGLCYAAGSFALAFCDLSTREVYCVETPSAQKALDEVARYKPSEMIMNADAKAEIGESVRLRFLCPCDEKDAEFFADTGSCGRHFGDAAAKLGDNLRAALSGMLEYLCLTQKSSVDFINTLNIYSVDDYMQLDMSARRSLEICENMRDGTKKGTLLGVLDRTKTSMGARRIRSWLDKPLINPIEIERRLDAVEELFKNTRLREELSYALDGIYDISRICTRVSLASVTPKDMASLRESLLRLPEVKYLLGSAKSDLLERLYGRLDLMEDVRELLSSAIAEAPAATFKNGGVIASGYSGELDELREIIGNGDEYIKNYAEAERERTGIKTLKVSYNKVFGYYIEVTKANSESVPEDYIRKQTLVSSERYITPQLKEFEEKYLGAAENIVRLENDIFEQVRKYVDAAAERLREACEVLSDSDALCALATAAVKNKYVRPRISRTGELTIKDGRHPVVEAMRRDTVFVPNDTLLDNGDNRLLIITGPNMAGKSTYMRQSALIVLMAQVGSFVPASAATVGVCDKIFTRVGASDDISQGQSTFMLEMSEVSDILHNATKNSLIILDEIGRGTSTFDGLSIAWAVAEYVANKKKIGAKTLFATHYHELCELEGKVDGVKNYSIAVKKRGDDITFLRKIVRGGTDDSFGIEVAALAGVPKEVVRRAKEVLVKVESGGEGYVINENPPQEPQAQLGFADGAAMELCRELACIDAATYTPIEAISKLFELSNKAKEIE